jgi:hypothetical protein
VKYRVIWHPRAEPLLKQIYDAALDKEGLAHTVQRIGLELEANPTQAGESRESNARILFKFPLIVWFFVDEQKAEVWIINVKRFRRMS